MSTVSEFLLAAEYIVAEGNTKVILCERGIRSFDRSTRNMLDIAGIAAIQKETSLPVVVDLSHSLGRKDILLPVMKAVLAMEVDGIMLEVHPDPKNALSDQQQQLDFIELENLLQVLIKIDRYHESRRVPSSNKFTLTTGLESIFGFIDRRYA